jgi:hypothetical protein
LLSVLPDNCTFRFWQIAAEPFAGHWFRNHHWISCKIPRKNRCFKNYFGIFWKWCCIWSIILIVGFIIEYFSKNVFLQLEIFDKFWKNYNYDTEVVIGTKIVSPQVKSRFTRCNWFLFPCVFAVGRGLPSIVH